MAGAVQARVTNLLKRINFMMKKLLVLVNFMLISTAANAAPMNCSYQSSSREYDKGFLFAVSAEFKCNGKTFELIGDNRYVSCKPQFLLSTFVDHLRTGEKVKLYLTRSDVSDIGGGSSAITFVAKAFSESGQKLMPNTLIQHDRQVQCSATQIEVWEK